MMVLVVRGYDLPYITAVVIELKFFNSSPGSSLGYINGKH